VRAHRLVQGVQSPVLGGDRRDHVPPLGPRRHQPQPVGDRVQPLVPVGDLVHLVHRHHHRDVEVLEQVVELHGVRDRLRPRVPVDDVHGRLPVEDDDPHEDPFGVGLEVADDVGLDLLAALLVDPAHEPEPGEVGDQEVLGRPVVVVGRPCHPRFLADGDRMPGELPHHRRFPDVRPADQHHLGAAVRSRLEHRTP